MTDAPPMPAVQAKKPAVPRRAPRQAPPRNWKRSPTAKHVLRPLPAKT